MGVVTMRYVRVLFVFMSAFFFSACQTVNEVGGMTPVDAFGAGLESSLVQAIKSGDYVAADNFLAAGADINRVGKDGITPLLWILIATLDERKLEYMLKHGANPNYRADVDSRKSAMYLLAGGNKTKLLELFLSNGGNPNMEENFGRSLLFVAINNAQTDNIKTLIKYGADVNHLDVDGYPAIDYALTLANFDDVILLLDNGLNKGLDKFARSIERRYVQLRQNDKERVMHMLEARGIVFPYSEERRRELAEREIPTSDWKDVVYGRKYYGDYPLKSK